MVSGRLRLQLIALGAYVASMAVICSFFFKGGSPWPAIFDEQHGNLDHRDLGETASSETPHQTSKDIIVNQNRYQCDPQDAADFLPENHVVRRALHGVVIGAQKGGTQALHNLLLTQPYILPSGKRHGELHFFIDRGGRFNLTRHPEGKIPRQSGRASFESALNRRPRLMPAENITRQENEKKVGIHSAPIYMFVGRIVPARLLCISPWTKVLAVLRNPIARAFSHYNFIRSWKTMYRGVRPSFDKFVTDDLELLRKAGVVQNWTETNFDSFAGSAAEFQAWEKYVTMALDKGPLGRGLYAIQLEIWMAEFKRHGKSIENDLLV